MQAAVLLLIVQKRPSANTPRVLLKPFDLTISAKSSIVFTLRSQKVEHHKGEISFPGGRKDPEDRNLEFTAQRETKEEIGIDATEYKILAELPQIHTYSSKFTITPFLGITLKEKLSYSLQDNETADVLELSFEHLFKHLDRFEEHQIPNTSKKLALPVFFPYETRSKEVDAQKIWGATAVILHSFLKSCCSYLT